MMKSGVQNGTQESWIIYMDNALLEVFVNHGEYAFTRRYEHYKTDYQIEAELSTGWQRDFL